VGINVAQLLRSWALRDPDRAALTSDENGARSALSYGQLDARARRARGALRAHGIQPGARVAISVQNGLGFLDAWFGGLYHGLTLLPIPPMSSAPELAYRLEHARAAALVTDESTRALAARAQESAPDTLLLDAGSLSEGSADDDGPAELPAASVAMVLYTSGTTGTPKGALIGHASLYTHTAALVHHTLQLTSDDVVLAALPLTHSYGIRMTLLAPFFAGARVHLLSRFSVPAVQAALREESVSWFPGVPTMFHALANGAMPRREGSRLRWCLSAGAPLAREVRLKAEAALGAPVRQGFGLTEATFTSVGSPNDAGGEDSVGRPVFGVEVRIADEQGASQPAGVSGEVWIRGQNVMAGYLDDAAATAEALGSGWLRSGDLGMLDAEGRLYIVDRIKDMILRGGFNVYPAEVEAVLLAHPAILDAVVVGVADEHYGEEVAAVVVERAGMSVDLDEFAKYLRSALSAVKVPRLLARVSALPVGPSGKLQRRVVRSDLARGAISVTRLPRAAAD
jgi:long-chain acyl-CoA synthetase